jgi:hypothetical protein
MARLTVTATTAGKDILLPDKKSSVCENGAA